MARKDITDEQCVRAALAAHGERSPMATDEILAEMTGQPLKVCEAALERALNRGYIDCGVRIGRAFAMPKGYQLLGLPVPD